MAGYFACEWCGPREPIGAADGATDILSIYYAGMGRDSLGVVHASCPPSERQKAKAVDATLAGPGGVQEMRDKIRDLVLKVERREQDVARLTARNAYLESELKMQERHITNALKDNIVLKQQLAKKKAAKRR